MSDNLFANSSSNDDGDDLFGDNNSDFSSIISSPFDEDPNNNNNNHQEQESSTTNDESAAVNDESIMLNQWNNTSSDHGHSSPSSPSHSSSPASSLSPSHNQQQEKQSATATVVVKEEEEEDLFGNSGSSNFADEFGSVDDNPFLKELGQQQQQQLSQSPPPPQDFSSSVGHHGAVSEQNWFHQVPHASQPPPLSSSSIMDQHYNNNGPYQQQQQQQQQQAQQNVDYMQSPPSSSSTVDPMMAMMMHNKPPQQIQVENQPLLMNPKIHQHTASVMSSSPLVVSPPVQDQSFPLQQQQQQNHTTHNQWNNGPSSTTTTTAAATLPPQQTTPLYGGQPQQQQQQQHSMMMMNPPHHSQHHHQTPSMMYTGGSQSAATMVNQSPFHPIPSHSPVMMMNPQQQHQQHQQTPSSSQPSSASSSPAPWQQQQAQQQGGPPPMNQQHWSASSPQPNNAYQQQQQQQQPPYDHSYQQYQNNQFNQQPQHRGSPWQQQQPLPHRQPTPTQGWAQEQQQQPPQSQWNQQHPSQWPQQQRQSPSPAHYQQQQQSQWNQQPPHMYGGQHWNQQQQQQPPMNGGGFGGGYGQHQQQVHQGMQYFKPPPALPIFSFGFGKTAFISANSTQVTVFNGLNGIVSNNRPEIVAALDIEDQNSKQNYLDFTLNTLLSHASREQWELWQVVQMMAKYGNDKNLLREQVCQFLLSFSSQEPLQSPQVQVAYNEAFILPFLQSGNVRGAIDEAMNRGMYAIALLLAQGWPELNMQQQVMQAVANSTAPVLGSLLGLSSNNTGKDWRRTVALILKNQCQSNGIGVIQSIGDNFWKDQRNVYSAHLCYIACGLLSADNEVLLNRVVLLGGDHKRNLKGFFNKETIERSLFIPEIAASQKFQPFKLVYALHLVSQCGNYALAQKYLNSIPKANYNAQFQYQLDVLSQRLRDVLGKSSGGFFNKAGGGGVTNWLFKSFENLIHGDESPQSAPQAVQRQSQALSQTPVVAQTPDRTLSTPPVTQAPKEQPQPSTKNTSHKKTGSWFSSLLGAKKKNEVNFGSDNELEYCSIRKKWVSKGMAGNVSAEELEKERKAMAPPEIPQMDFLNTSGPSISRRGGHLDLFNTNAPPTSSASPIPSMLPQSTSGGPPLSRPPTSFFVPSSSGAPPLTPMQPTFVPNQDSGAPSYSPPIATSLGHRSQSVPVGPPSTDSGPPHRISTPLN